MNESRIAIIISGISISLSIGLTLWAAHLYKNKVRPLLGAASIFKF